MKTNSGKRTILQRIVAGSLSLVPILLFISPMACTEPPPPPPASGDSSVNVQEGVPGGVVVNTMKVSVRVVSVDHANRKATLMDENGEELTVTVGPEAVNFDQVKEGDLVKVTVTEKVVISLDKEGVARSDAEAGVVTLAPKGAKPRGLVAQATQIVGIIISIDQENRTVKLRFEDNSTKTFPVRDDIDLSQHKPGERVVFQITEMVAISVEKE